MEKIINIIMYIVGVVAAILILIFRNNLFLITAIGSVVLLVLGICFILLKKTYGYLCVGIGFSTIIAVILYKSKVLVLADSITFTFCLSIVITMLTAFILECYRRKKILETHTLVVEAQVVDLEKNPNLKKEAYLPIYAYSVKDENYDVPYVRYFTKNVPDIGSIKEIKLNPLDHMDVYFEQELKDKIFNITCMFFLIIVSLIVIIGLF